MFLTRPQDRGYFVSLFFLPLKIVLEGGEKSLKRTKTVLLFHLFYFSLPKSFVLIFQLYLKEIIASSHVLEKRLLSLLLMSQIV